MSLGDLPNWINERFSDNSTWLVKRLSGNDTLANGTHQAGPYFPKRFLFDVLQGLNQRDDENPSIWFELHVDSHEDSRRVRAIWYNNKLRGGTRDETRITNWGGADSALLRPENTGALCVFAFRKGNARKPGACRVWVCTREDEEEFVSGFIGQVDPGYPLVFTHEERAGLSRQSISAAGLKDAGFRASDFPSEWNDSFPSAQAIVNKVSELHPEPSLPPDKRLMRRRVLEYDLFKTVEEAITQPLVGRGFDSVDSFASLALTVLQRRKSRSGLSLELHARTIFKEEGLLEDVQFSYNKRTEGRRRPDFLFPSEIAYRAKTYPAENLRMLAVKTTCRDRWRQILNEAERIDRKHLLTLQEGVSEEQFSEMLESNVQLVVPAPLVKKFPQSVRPKLQSFGEFIQEIRNSESSEP